jgi:hypothetical protein
LTAARFSIKRDIDHRAVYSKCSRLSFASSNIPTDIAFPQPQSDILFDLSGLYLFLQQWTSRVEATSVDALVAAMSVVSLLGVKILNNPAPFTAPYEFEITFECLEQLKEGAHCEAGSVTFGLTDHFHRS